MKFSLSWSTSSILGHFVTFWFILLKFVQLQDFGWSFLTTFGNFLKSLGNFLTFYWGTFQIFGELFDIIGELSHNFGKLFNIIEELLTNCVLAILTDLVNFGEFWVILLHLD